MGNVEKGIIKSVEELKKGKPITIEADGAEYSVWYDTGLFHGELIKKGYTCPEKVIRDMIKEIEDVEERKVTHVEYR